MNKTIRELATDPLRYDRGEMVFEHFPHALNSFKKSKNITQKRRQSVNDRRRLQEIHDAAQQAGFELLVHEPITPPIWRIEEHPRYAAYKDKPFFHLFDFKLKS